MVVQEILHRAVAVVDGIQMPRTATVFGLAQIQNLVGSMEFFGR